jgi:hypothetical protein
MNIGVKQISCRMRRHWLIGGVILEILMVILTVLTLQRPYHDGDNGAENSSPLDMKNGSSTEQDIELSYERLLQIASASNPVAHISEQIFGTEKLENLDRGVIVPSGDTILMRRLGLAPPIPYSIIQRFQAVALSQDERFRFDELARLSEEPIPIVRYRALLERVRTAMRSSGGQMSEGAVIDMNRALAITDIDDKLKVDSFYFKAIYFEQQEDLLSAYRAINLTLEMDDIFIWAHWKRVAIIAELLEKNNKNFRSINFRQKLVRDLIVSLNHVTALTHGANAVYDLIKTARPLRRASDPNAVFALGYLYFVAGDTSRARKIFVQINDTCKALLDRCVPTVATAAAALLELTGDKK